MLSFVKVMIARARFLADLHIHDQLCFPFPSSRFLSLSFKCKQCILYKGQIFLAEEFYVRYIDTLPFREGKLILHLSVDYIQLSQFHRIRYGKGKGVDLQWRNLAVWKSGLAVRVALSIIQPLSRFSSSQFPRIWKIKSILSRSTTLFIAF